MFSIVPYYDQGTVQIDGEEVASGEKKSFFINSGSYEIIVTAEDGITTKTYTLQVYRETEIHKAVDNSQLANGDILTVVPGHYEEAEEIDLPDKAIYLLSLDPQDNTIRENTIIDGCDSHRVFRLININETPTVSGFTMQNGLARYGSGILFNNAAANIFYNIIKQNHNPLSDYGTGGGIFIINSSPFVVHNSILDNENGHGGGIGIRDNSSPKIENNIIQNNHAQSSKGGGIHLYNVSGIVTLKNNTISNNEAQYHGGGIYCEKSSPVINSNSNISFNKSFYGSGGGIFIKDSSPTIKNNGILSNVATIYGGGIAIEGEASEPEITHNVIIHDNESGNMGDDDIYIISGNPTINNNGGPPVIWP